MPPRKPQFRIDRLAALQQIAADRGGECLESQYIDSELPMAFRCARGHRWTTQARIVRNLGSWCPECCGGRPVTLAGMQTIARAHGGECLSPAVGTIRTLLRWRCADGHEWEARPAKIRGGSWCPRCAGFVDIADMRAYAAERGGKCLSRVYTNGNTPLKWQCAAGHRLSAIWRIVRLGRWCGLCRVYDVNSSQKLAWERREGHRWWASTANVHYNSSWCPVCGARRSAAAARERV